MGKNSEKDNKIPRKPGKSVTDRLRESRIFTTFLILTLVLMVCYACYIFSDARENGLTFWDVFIYNMLALAGNDYEFTGTPAGRLLGLIVLSLGVLALSTITGFISSSLVARNLSAQRGLKKMQNMKDHIIICGWKNDVKSLILGILRKNKNLGASDIILITGADDVKIQALKDALRHAAEAGREGVAAGEQRGAEINGAVLSVFNEVRHVRRLCRSSFCISSAARSDAACRRGRGRSGRSSSAS